MQAGHIDRNFTLYTSTFHGDRVSPAATNFIIHHVDRDLMDPYFELTSDDVDATVRERGINALKEPALYNIAILDRLLETNLEVADIMIGSLDPLGERQREFLQAYLTRGKTPILFVSRITVLSKNAFLFLVNETEADEILLLNAINVALMHMPSSEQKVDSNVSHYLLDKYSRLLILTDSNDSAQIEKVADLFTKAEIKVPSLEPLSADARKIFVSLNLYEVTYENLSIALGNNENLALDVIQATDDTVYSYVTEHLGTYLEAIDGFSSTIRDCAEFIPLLEDLFREEDSSFLAHASVIVKNASPECKVSNLSDISEFYWPVLATDHRFPATFKNVSLYIGKRGIDQELGSLIMTASEIIELEDVEEDEKSKMAIEILNAQNVEALGAPDLRVNLVASLDLKYYLDVSLIPTENGELFASLLRNNIIQDNADSYKRLAATDWNTRRSYIRESSDFISYMTPELLKSDLSTLLTDDEVNNAIKRDIVEHSSEYVSDAESQAIIEIAHLAVQFKITIPLEVLEVMAEASAPPQDLVVLLQPHLGATPIESLNRILNKMGDNYSQLTFEGREQVLISNTPEDKALLEHLEIVSAYREEGSVLRVFKRHKPRPSSR